MTDRDIREALGQLFRLRHRDSCYPDALDFEMESFADAALSILSTALAERDARIAELEGLITVLLENEPDDTVSDAGHTVLDLWRHEARAKLKEPQQ